MGRTRKKPAPPKSAITRVEHKVSCRLLTVDENHSLWDRTTGNALDVLNSFVRLVPPSTVTADDIEVAKAALKQAGARGIRSMPRAAAEEAQQPAFEEAETYEAVNFRQRAIRRAESMKGVRDLPALKDALDASLSEAGL